MRSAVAAAPWAPSGLEDPRPRVVRGPARLARGWAGALAMTALAALFHTAAEPGHGFPEVGVVAFAAVLAAPLCTALAGRALSLWRTAAAVAIAQGLFHVLYGLAAGGHGPLVEAWHAVPDDLGRRKDRAEAFAAAWRRWLGPAELVFTQRDGPGREALAAAVAQDWSYDTQRRAVWQ